MFKNAADKLHLDSCFVCKQKPVILTWKATAEDHVIDLTAIVVATRHWGGVDDKTKEGFNSIFVVSLHQIGAWRAFHRTPAETGWGTSAPAFGQTSLQAQKQERGDLVGSLLGRGRVISQDPCSVSAPGYTGYIAGGPPLPVPEGSPYPLDEPQLKKGWNQTLNTSPHQPALTRTAKMNWEKGVVWKFGFHPKCLLPKSCLIYWYSMRIICIYSSFIWGNWMMSVKHKI